MGKMTDHQSRVQKALEGNERVWFHPFEDKLAVWHGGAQVTVYDSQTFEEKGVLCNVRTHNRSMSKIEDAVTMKVLAEGFDRVGRSQDNTRVIKA